MSANGAISQYVPFTPFQQSHELEAEPAALESFEHGGAPAGFTPFVSEYAGVDGPSAEATEFQELLQELHDDEFDEVLAEIAHEAWEAVTNRAEALGETGPVEPSERFLQEWSQPVRREADTLLENIAEAVSEHDLYAMAEAEIDTFFERFEPQGTGLEGHFEDFLGGLVKKAKKLAKKAVGVAKKGLTMLPGISALLRKLKALVRPLLDRVLKTAIDRLPPTLRPLASQLAQRLLRGTASEVEDDDELEGAAAALDVSALQEQLDLGAATLMFASNGLEQELVVGEAMHGAENEDGASVADLHEARERFVADLEAGVDPEQALEQFIPAVMAVLPAARTVIRVIGRKRVVSFLAGALAAYIGRYVPKAQAGQLSSAIVDAGLKMLDLESTDPDRLASETLTQTVEDTVRRIAEHDDATFDEEELLELALAEAFHEAAAENFPPDLLVPEVHEAPLRATWVGLPAGAPRRYYKKYTHVFDVEITAQAADSIRTFRGVTLAAFLKDQLGVTPPVRARVHLYQAIAGTTLRRIARLERGVPGLGSPRTGTDQFHQLTKEAAGILLGQPKLGRAVPAPIGAARRAVAVGQRFYYLEIAGARPVLVGAGGRARLRRTSHVHLAADVPRDEYRASIYLSEAQAQEVAARIRRRDLTAALMLARRAYASALAPAVGDVRGLPEPLRRRLAKQVDPMITRAFAEHFKQASAEFLAATENAEDGVTVSIRASGASDTPTLSVRTMPGHRRA